MHTFWLSLRQAVHERETAKVLQTKVDRNDLCPCDSGNECTKCYGAAANLQSSRSAHKQLTGRTWLLGVLSIPIQQLSRCSI